jgi:anti-sigma factor RsiW
LSASRISDELLHAYVDGRLDPRRRAEMEDWLAEHPTVAEQVRDYRLLNERVRAVYDPVLREPIPERLLPARRRAPPKAALQAAAAVVLLLVGGVAGWVLRGGWPADAGPVLDLARHAASAHVVYVPEVRHPVEVPGEEESHLVGWLSKRLGADIRAPNLRPLGYQLVGGRLVPADGRPAAFFMYQNELGNRLTLYVRTGMATQRETAFRYAEDTGVRVFYWVDGPLGYALVGDADRDYLLRAAHSVFSELNP